MNIICSNCGGKKYGNKFNEKLIEHSEDIKHDIHHPWWTYGGITLTLIFVLIIIVASIT